MSMSSISFKSDRSVLSRCVAFDLCCGETLPCGNLVAVPSIPPSGISRHTSPKREEGKWNAKGGVGRQGARTDVDGDVAGVDAPLEFAHLGVVAAAPEQTWRLHSEVAHLAADHNPRSAPVTSSS